MNAAKLTSAVKPSILLSNSGFRTTPDGWCSTGLISAAIVSTETRNHKHHQAATKPVAWANSLSGPNLACDSGSVVYAYRLNFIWIGVMWCTKPPKCHNFDQIFTLWGAHVPIPLYQSQPTLAGKSRPIHQISCESIYCVTFQGRKTATLGKCWHLEGFCTQPPLPTRAEFGMLDYTHSVYLPAKFCLDQFILSHLGGSNAVWIQCTHDSDWIRLQWVLRS